MIVGFFDEARMLAAWYELRQDFRHFRTDRIVDAAFVEDRHGVRPGVLRQRWRRKLREEARHPPPA